MKKLLLGGLVGIGGALSGIPALAQSSTAPSGESTAALPTVVVTAQRREQSAQDVGAALTVLSGEDLTNKGITNINKLQYEVPNVEIDPQYGSGQPLFRIRGVGLKDYATNNTSTVGVYVDEVAYPFPVQTQGLLFDIDRVEVLRGPQGTLYGRNSTGGAINFLSRRPTQVFDAGVTASYGSYNAKTVEGYVSGPFSDALRGRLSFAREQGGAWQYNRGTGQSLGDKDTLALRGQLELDATRDLKLNLTVHHGQDKSESQGPRLYQGLVPNAAGKALGFSTIAAEKDPRVTGWSLTPAFAKVTGLSVGDKPHRDNQSDGAALTANWEFDKVKLTSITSTESFKRREFIDWDGSAIPQSDEYFKSNIGVFSQELRLASKGQNRFNWLAGVYYGRENLDEKFYSDFTGNLGYATLTAYKQKADVLAAFGQGDYKLTENTRVVLGLRQEHETRKLENFTTSYALYPAQPAKVGTSTFPAQDRSLTSDETSGKLGLEYQLRKGTLLYTSVSRGVKSGGFTAYNSSFPQQVDAVKPEVLWAYEVGAKSDVTRSLRLNASAFYYDYRDQQYQSQVFIDPVIKNVGRLVNIPKSEIYGLELELQWEPIAGLTIGQYLGYKEGYYKEYKGLDVAATKANGYTAPVYSDFAGQELTNFPKTSYGGSLSYTWTQGGFRYTAQGDYVFHDTLKSSVPAYNTNSYWLANTRFAVTQPGAKWTAALWVRNLLNTKYDLYHGSFLSNAQIATSGMPRTIGIQGIYNF